MSGVALWRPAFILSALLLMVGGPQHPEGTMVEMLGHPAWVRAHSLMLAGFVVLFVGLLLFRANPSFPDRTQRWTRYALVGTGLQVVEMVLHTAAVVDHANLAAGDATPVLTTHLAASLVFYPAFSATVVGLIVVAARDGVLGSPWISWLGVVGLVANGIAPALVLAGFDDARLLFRLLMLFAVWLILSSLWGIGRTAERPASGATVRP